MKSVINYKRELLITKGKQGLEKSANSAKLPKVTTIFLAMWVKGQRKPSEGREVSKIRKSNKDFICDVLNTC